MIPVPLPITPGHEVAGCVEEIGDSVPQGVLDKGENKITQDKGVNVVIDCVGAEETIRDSVRILNKSGVLVVVGLFGNEIKIPLVSSVINE